MTEMPLQEQMMARAIRLARRGEGKTSPNPMVGAVLYDQQGVIATGYHTRAGKPHAEIVALHKAGERGRGASLAVNLEPCCHVGRTGPCTQAIIDSGIAEVIYAIDDPNKQVSGNGARILEQSGIKVTSGVHADEASRLNEVYLKFIATGRPFVALKMAQSLDGRIATSRGESRWISGDEAQKFAHRLRSRYDAVVVGSGTVRADNPRLTVRHLKARNPFRIIVSSSGKISPNANLIADNGDGKTIVVTGLKTKVSQKLVMTDIWRLKTSRLGIDLHHLLRQMAQHEMTSLLIEGGSRLATAFLRLGLVDKIYAIISPLIIGEGIPSLGDLGVSRLTGAIRFREFGFTPLGDDMLFWGYPEK